MLNQSLFAGFQITENTTQRFSFSWEIKGTKISDTLNKPSELSFSDQNVAIGDSGEPIIPACSFYIGVPLQGTVKINVTPQIIKTIHLKNALRIGLGNPHLKRFPNLRFDNPWISNAVSCTFGQLSANRFILKPLHYDEKSNTIQVLEKADIAIVFPSNKTNTFFNASSNSDIQKMVSRLLLNYTVAKEWATPRQALSKQKIMTEFPLAPTKPMISFEIGDGFNGINEGTIHENGIIKISGKKIDSLLGNTIQINQLTCYGSHKGELPSIVPDIAEIPDGITQIPLMRYDLNNNGIIDSEDYVLLYVTGTSDWEFNTKSSQYYYNLNRYEDYRHYWLTIKALGSSGNLGKMEPSKDVATMKRSSFQNHFLIKSPNCVGAEVGLDWCLKLLSINSDYNYPNPISLPLVDSTNLVSIKLSVSKAVGPINFSGSVISSLGDQNSWYDLEYKGNKMLSIKRGNDFDTTAVEIRQLEFKYSTNLDMEKDSTLTVFSPESLGIVKFTIINLPKQCTYIFRITPTESIQLIDTVQGSSTSSYSWTDSAGKGIKYYICSQSSFKPLPRLIGLQYPSTDNSDHFIIHDLRATNAPASNQADYLIISDSLFLHQARILAQHKNDIRQFIYPKVVDIKDVYREFSGGVTDPAALRNFLVYTKSQWGVSPDYVVLMGRGNYDYKGITQREREYIPVAEISGLCVDDYFSYLDAGEDPASENATPDIFIGRIPCTNSTDATQIIDKIIDYEDSTKADSSAWRNRIVLVNDDDMQGSSHDNISLGHLNSSEVVSESITSLRPSVDVRKVNLFEYPWNELYYKPEARAALIKEINNGAAYINFFGHGSSGQWADEKIFDSDALPSLRNSNKYPIILSFSCNVGHFDAPGNQSLAEAIIFALQKGAIASIAATREAQPGDNENMATYFFKGMFDTTASGTTFGEAYAASKIQTHDGNSKMYAFFSDPSLRPVNCAHSVSLDIFDKTKIAIDTLKALQSITVHGSIKMSGGSVIDANYGSTSSPAFIQLTILNPPYTTSRKDKGADQSVTYSLPGTVIYSNQVSVKNGTFEQTIHLPKKVTFNKPGSKIIAFAWRRHENAMGYKNIFFNGSVLPDSGIADTLGPVIAVRQFTDASKGAEFSVQALANDKIRAVLPFSCEIDAFDPSGIDASETGPDEGLTIEIPGALSKQNINSKFSYIDGDYKKGSAIFQFTEGMIHSGTYTMSISAQDLVGNTTRKIFVLEISQAQDLAISQVFNFPNPMKMGGSTRFYFNLSKTSGVSSTIKVYTLSGKLLRVFNGAYSGEIFDGRDQVGNFLGPKVYLYQVIAEDNSQSSIKIVKSGIQKLVVHPPR